MLATGNGSTDTLTQALCFLCLFGHRILLFVCLCLDTPVNILQNWNRIELTLRNSTL